MNLFFNTIQIKTSNSANSDKTVFSFYHVVFTKIISEFWVGIKRFKFYYIPPHGVATPHLFVLKCGFILILAISLGKKSVRL